MERYNGLDVEVEGSGWAGEKVEKLRRIVMLPLGFNSVPLPCASGDSGSPAIPPIPNHILAGHDS